jgi:ABC-2 type transport system ATP-binding protein
MKERLGIAQSLINKPKILILDEPTNGLDPTGVKKIFDILKNMKDTTIIISSHMLSEIESLCDKVIFINNGQIVDIKKIDKNVSKRNIIFEVDDFSKAKLLLSNYCINEELEVYESDATISRLNRELIFNNINVYRIYEKENTIEKEFFDMVNNDE